MGEPTIRWRAWYADGTLYESTNISWTDLPDDGIVSVVVYGELIPNLPEKKRYRRVMDGDDLYFFLEDTIVCNNHSIEDNLKRYPNAKDFKRGKWVSDKMFQEISDQAWGSTWQ